MIGFLLRATVGTIALALMAYTIVAVPVGRRTLYEHGVEIVHTRPAQELGEDLRGAATDVVARVRAPLAEEAHDEQSNTVASAPTTPRSAPHTTARNTRKKP